MQNHLAVAVGIPFGAMQSGRSRSKFTKMTLKTSQRGLAALKNIPHKMGHSTQSVR